MTAGQILISGAPYYLTYQRDNATAENVTAVNNNYGNPCNTTVDESSSTTQIPINVTTTPVTVAVTAISSGNLKRLCLIRQPESVFSHAT